MEVLHSSETYNVLIVSVLKKKMVNQPEIKRIYYCPIEIIKVLTD